MGSPARRAAPPVCVTATGFPVPGGIRGVLTETAAAIADVQPIEFLTHRTTPHDSQLTIHEFGGRLANPFSFPDALVYAGTGLVALLRLQRRRRYLALISQDVLYTGLFTGVVARLTGARFVVMDHGSGIVAFDRTFQAKKLAVPLPRSERGADLLTRIHVRTASLRRKAYFASLGLVVRAVEGLRPDYLLVGDEEVQLFSKRLRVSQERIHRYDYAVDVDTFAPLDANARREHRVDLGVSPTTLVITFANRLTPEKGLEEALPVVAQAVRDSGKECLVVIAGDGELRPSLQHLTAVHGIGDCTRFVGSLGRDAMAALLGISDVFVYTGTAGTNQSVAILEAMASGCAVVATPIPTSNRVLLADGRGRVVEVGDAPALYRALLELIQSEPIRVSTGASAREYARRNHTRAALRRRLLDVLHE